MAPSDEGAVSGADWGIVIHRQRQSLRLPCGQPPPFAQGRLWVRCRKGERYMKATGIVRRVEECVIIGQTDRNPHKHWFFAGLPYWTHWCQNRVWVVFIHSNSEVKFTSLLWLVQHFICYINQSFEISRQLFLASIYVRCVCSKKSIIRSEFLHRIINGTIFWISK